MSATLLEVTDLRKHYSQRRGLISALTGQGCPELLRAVARELAKKK